MILQFSKWPVGLLPASISAKWRYAIGLTPGLNPEQEKRPPRVSVVVVSHDRVELLRRCLRALESSEGRETLQLIVVDNGSSDGSQRLDEEFPQVQFIRLPKNFGLTKALNLGWRAADAEYVLFLHDDTEVTPETVVHLAGILDASPEAGAVCPLLVDAEGRPGPQIGHFPPDGEYRAAVSSSDAPFAVEFARGAALMIRVMLIKAVRQIDERYGQYGSDADLAAQLLRASRKTLLVPTVRVRHEGDRVPDGLDRADLLLGKALFQQKYSGLGAGIQSRLGAVLKPLISLDLGAFWHALAGQKIDGTQG
jgi:glycosyltransferase involved in cell wall biosynthesis